MSDPTLQSSPFPETSPAVVLSIVVPMYNEEECIVPFCEELDGVLDGLADEAEVILVDDGSTDRTPEILAEQVSARHRFRSLRLEPNAGQSAAMGEGFNAARGEVVVTLDADGQNDPADIPRLLEALPEVDMCCGYRAVRKDSLAKRIGSRFGNTVRNRMLGEEIRDTGCTLKAVKVEYVKHLMMFDGLHRFLPALVRMQGGTLCQIPVNHRPRTAGQSKYTNFGRLKKVGADLKAVAWMRRRYRHYEVIHDE